MGVCWIICCFDCREFADIGKNFPVDDEGFENNSLLFEFLLEHNEHKIGIHGDTGEPWDTIIESSRSKEEGRWKEFESKY